MPHRPLTFDDLIKDQQAFIGPPLSRSPLFGSASICVAEWEHSCPQQFWSGAAVHCAFEGFQAIDLTFRLAVAPGHLDGVFDRIEVPIQGAGKAHDWRQVGFNRVVNPCRERVCHATSQDAIEPHGEAAHRGKSGRAGLERVGFPRLIRGELAARFDAQRRRDDRGDRVNRPGFPRG